MGEYSEMVGSFVRRGPFPMEANYVFPTEAALKEFYEDPVNSATLHKGLLRVVENVDGKQALYWVTKKQTNDLLEFTKLISGTNIDSIFELLLGIEARLLKEVEDRRSSETAIWGTIDPTNVPEELNSLFDLATVVIDIKDEVAKIHQELIDSDDSIYKSLKTEVKTLVGTLEYNVVEYLKTLPYKSLTEVSNVLNKFMNEVDTTSNLINTLPELKSFLEGYTDKQKLRHVLLDLQKEILGKPVPSQEFRTLRAIEDFVRVLGANLESSDRNLLSELDQTQIGVGLNADGSYSADKETYYLKDATSVMNALKTLDALMFTAISGITIESESKDVVDLAVRKELEGYIVSAKLKLSNLLGNDLVKKDDGLYFNVDSTYKDGILKILVNGKVIALHVLGFSSLVDTARYDPTQESIIIVFKLLNGDKQTVSIPVGTLIREWDVDNALPGKVVELTRTISIDGPDTLSADVRLWSDKSNILRKYGNTLGVEGTTENVTHNGEALKVFLDVLKSTIDSGNATINNKIDSEISRALKKESELKEEISKAKSELDKDIEDVSDAVLSVSNAVGAETNRANAAENALQSQINNLKATDLEIKRINELHMTKISSLEKQLSDLNRSIWVEELRATSVESNLEQRISSIEGELSDISQKQTALDSDIKEVDHKVDLLKRDLSLEIHLVRDGIDEKIAGKAEQSDLNVLNTKVETVSGKVDDLKQAIEEVQEDVKNVSTENFYTKKETQDLISGKADLVNGKIPPDQVSFYIIEVE